MEAVQIMPTTALPAELNGSPDGAGGLAIARASADGPSAFGQLFAITRATGGQPETASPVWPDGAGSLLAAFPELAAEMTAGTREPGGPTGRQAARNLLAELVNGKIRTGAGSEEGAGVPSVATLEELLASAAAARTADPGESREGPTVQEEPAAEGPETATTDVASLLLLAASANLAPQAGPAEAGRGGSQQTDNGTGSGISQPVAPAASQWDDHGMHSVSADEGAAEQQAMADSVLAEGAEGTDSLFSEELSAAGQPAENGRKAGGETASAAAPGTGATAAARWSGKGGESTETGQGERWNNQPDQERVEVLVKDLPHETPAAKSQAADPASPQQAQGPGEPSPAVPVAHGYLGTAVPAAETSSPAEGAGQPISQEQILQQVQEKLARHEVRPGGGEVRLKLHPEELGELTINLRMEDQRLRVEIVAENRTVKEALLQNLDTLRDTLSRQNISMERFDVATGGNPHQAFREERQAQAARVPTPYGSRQPGNDDGQAAVHPASRWEVRRDALVDLRL